MHSNNSKCDTELVNSNSNKCDTELCSPEIVCCCITIGISNTVSVTLHWCDLALVF